MHLKTKVSLWLVLFVVFLDFMGFGLVYPMFSSMLFLPDNSLLADKTSDHVRGIYLGILLAVPSIAQFFSGPILGSLSDQKGRKPLFLWSIGLAVFGYMSCILGVLINSILCLILARFIIGIASGNAGVACATIADLSEPKEKAKFFGLYSMALGIGFTVGPFLGGKFSETNFILPFVIAGIATILNWVLIYFFFKETLTQRTKATLSFTEGLKNLKKAFHMYNLRTLFVTVMIFCFGWSFFYEFMPVTWILEFKFNPSKIGLFYAYGAAFYALSSGFLIRPFLNRFKHLSIIFYSLATLGCLIFSIAFSSHVFLIWIYLPIINFLTALIFPTYSAMVSDSVDKNSQGEILGILQSVEAVALGLSPLAAGAMLAAHPHMPMFLGGSAILLATILFGLLLRKKIFLNQTKS
ncbi:MAG: MFS transporter [Chlamydiota bacterium]